MIRTALLTATTALAAFAVLPAVAQTAPNANPPGGSNDIATQFDRDTVTVGIGAAWVPDYDGSAHHRVVPAPVVLATYKGLNLQLLGNRATLNVIPQKPGPSFNFEAGPIAVINFNRTSINNIDDVRVRRLGELKTGIELGGYVGVSKTGVITSPYDKLTVTVSYRHDVASANKSYVVTPTISYLTPLSTKAAVGLLASGTFYGDKYANYYYSVSPAQSVTTGLPVYAAKGGWNGITAGGFATYSLTGNLLHGFKVIAGGTYSRNAGASGDTPLTSLIGRRNQWIGAAGLAYTF